MANSRPARLRDLDLERHLNDPALRQSFVTPMFDLIAPRYDRFTRFFSFGMDRRWKETLVREASSSIVDRGSVADVATGTGDLAFALAARRPDLTVAATDVSGEMLARTLERRNRHSASNVIVAAGNLIALPFPPASLDAVTAGYALRNTPDWRVSIAELASVIRPGGHLFTLDFFLPENAWWRSLFLAWLTVSGKTVGWLWHREPVTYGYIAASIRHFATAREFSDRLRQEGFEVTATHLRLGGGIALHHAVKR